jgi:hypothetical protein
MIDLSPGELAVLMQLSRRQLTESGDIIGKQSRDSLVRRGLADRSHGFANLAQAGAAVRERMDRVSLELG